MFAFSYCGDNEQALDILRRLRATEELGAEDAKKVNTHLWVRNKGALAGDEIGLSKALRAYARTLEGGDE